MKILVVHNAYQSHQIGGEDLVVAREVAGLQQYLGQDNVFEYIVSNDDIRLKNLARNIWGDQHHFANITQLVSEHKIDIVHVHNFFPLLTPSVFEAAKKAGALVVHTLHNFRWWCLSGILYRNDAGPCEKCVNKKWGWPAVVNKCYRNSAVQSLAGTMAFSWYDYKKYQQYIDAFFVLSQFQREKLKSYIDSDKMWLKPNPIDQPGPLTPHDQKKNYLFVGRLESAKGINELLATWDTLPAQFHLDIIGDGPDRAKLQTQYTKANIQFLGQLPNETVLKKMSAAKYLMHTSLAYETFGLTMIEALARGTPVIGFNIGTRPELVHSGQNGFLTTPDQLRVTIMQSHDYPDYATLSQNAFESAQSFYTPQVLEQQIQYYQQWMCH